MSLANVAAAEALNAQYSADLPRADDEPYARAGQRAARVPEKPDISLPQGRLVARAEHSTASWVPPRVKATMPRRLVKTSGAAHARSGIRRR